jgi:hypothetical protein
MDFIFQIDKLCKNDHDEDAIFCRMSAKRFFSYVNVIIMGTKINSISMAPVKERYANKINLTRANQPKLNKSVAQASH